MEKIKAALHIHDKTPIGNDGAVGNMQNPSSSNPNEPTATELWGAGNADSIHKIHHDRQADTVAAAGAEGAKGGPHHQQREHMGSIPEGGRPGQNAAAPIGGPVPVADDAFARAQKAQAQIPQGASGNAVAQDIPQSSVRIPEEKVGSSSPDQWTQIDPFNQPQPVDETGPGTHFPPVPNTAAAGAGGPALNQGGHTALNQSGHTASSQGGHTASNQGGHTAYYDQATGREPHTTRG